MSYGTLSTNAGSLVHLRWSPLFVWPPIPSVKPPCWKDSGDRRHVFFFFFFSHLNCCRLSSSEPYCFAMEKRMGHAIVQSCPIYPIVQSIIIYPYFLLVILELLVFKDGYGTSIFPVVFLSGFSGLANHLRCDLLRGIPGTLSVGAFQEARIGTIFLGKNQGLEVMIFG